MIFRELIQGGFGILMFQNCQVCEFCRLELFQYRAFAAPFKALTLLYTLRRIQPLQTYINFNQRLPDTSSRYPGTLQDNNRHQTTPADVARHRKRLFKDMWQIILTSNGVCWRLTVSDDVLYCLCCLLMLKGCLRNLSTGI